LCEGTALNASASWRVRKIAKKETINVVISVCLLVRSSVRMEHLGSQWQDFHEIWYFRIFRTPAEKIQVSLR